MKRLLAALCFAGSLAQAAETPVIRFVTCPTYRDTDAGRKSGCWLADDPANGTRYDVSPAISKPDWHFAILVEGRPASTDANPCGGVVLDPVRTSVLDQPCPAHMLPAEGYPGRRFELPRRNVVPLSVARPAPQPPFGDRTWHIFFEFGRSFLTYQYDDYLLDTAAFWLKTAKPPHIVITGYAVTTPLEVSGLSLTEPDAIAAERAQIVRVSLTRLGFDPATITIRSAVNPPPTDDPEADGLTQSSRRRVDITAEFR